jgi:PAS domain S-box-containing protein
VLVVPGDAPDLAPLWRWAESRSVVLDAAASFDAAEERVRANGPDLIVCDARQSAGRGLELLATARAQGASAPFVLLTDDFSEELADQARAFGRGVCLPGRLLSEQTFDEVVKLALNGQQAEVQDAEKSPPRPAQLAPAMLWRAGPGGGFTAITQLWSRFTGRDPSEELGHAWTTGLHADDRERWRDTYSAALRESQPFSADVRLQRADGAFRWLRITGLPQADDGGELVGFAGAAVDVTDLREANAGFLSDIERMSGVQRDLEQFAYAAAHDLDEPLRTLEKALTGEEGELDPARREQSLGSARRMRALIRDLLECSLVGVSQTPMEEIDLSTPLDWAVQNLERRLRESGARVTRGTLPVVRCDAIQLARVFQNLVSNAIKFRSEEAPRVHVGARGTKGEVVIAVADNGIGIPIEQHERIFEPFKRVHARPSAPDESDPSSGSGIGLALCRRIAERHGGRIWVESEPGKGSIFYLAVSTS